MYYLHATLAAFLLAAEGAKEKLTKENAEKRVSLAPRATADRGGSDKLLKKFDQNFYEKEFFDSSCTKRLKVFGKLENLFPKRFSKIPYINNSLSPSSDIIVTPRSCALVSLLPAASPATT